MVVIGEESSLVDVLPGAAGWPDDDPSLGWDLVGVGRPAVGVDASAAGENSAAAAAPVEVEPVGDKAAYFVDLDLHVVESVGQEPNAGVEEAPVAAGN